MKYIGKSLSLNERSSSGVDRNGHKLWDVETGGLNNALDFLNHLKINFAINLEVQNSSPEIG